MASATRARDWASVDYYALLGVPAGADAAEITRAFRAQVKQSHPDTSAGADASARFGDVTAAYAVLGDPRARREYDRVRAEARAPGPPATGGRTAAPVRKPWSRRRAWTVVVAGVIVAVLGVGAAILTWTLHEHDARQRARFVPVVAQRVDDHGAALVEFRTRDGRLVRTGEPHQHGDPSALGPTVKIRYDPADPRHVIVDASSAGRDITFAIVALKLLIGGPVLAGYGVRRLRAVRA